MLGNRGREKKSAPLTKRQAKRKDEGNTVSALPSPFLASYVYASSRVAPPARRMPPPPKARCCPCYGHPPPTRIFFSLERGTPTADEWSQTSSPLWLAPCAAHEAEGAHSGRLAVTTALHAPAPPLSSSSLGRSPRTGPSHSPVRVRIPPPRPLSPPLPVRCCMESAEWDGHACRIVSARESALCAEAAAKE